jgi:hypothetical protein
MIEHLCVSIGVSVQTKAIQGLWLILNHTHINISCRSNQQSVEQISRETINRIHVCRFLVDHFVHQLI